MLEKRGLVGSGEEEGGQSANCKPSNRTAAQSIPWKPKKEVR